MPKAPPAKGAPKRGAAHLISRAEMARRLGVSRAAVTRACKAGGRLAGALSGSGVNVLHDDARRWLVQRKAATAAAKATLQPLADGPIPVDDEADDEASRPPAAELERELGPVLLGTDLDDLAEPLTALTERYGDAPAFAAWVKCRKMLEEARKAEMLRARIEGRLIARTTVIRMLERIDQAFRLLLSDAPRTIATRLSAPDVPGATALIRDLMTPFLEAALDQVVAALEADDPMQPLAEAAE